ncbi:MAG: hypothetical protein AAGE01_25425 [Pseudomonadota bacterium]
MEWDQLKDQWQAQSADAQPAPPAKIDKLRKQIIRRDRLETIVAVCMMPFFVLTGVFGAMDGNWAMVGFCVFLLGALIYIPWRLWKTRQMLPEPDPNRPVREYLAAEREAMLGQAEMLRNVWRWYLAPIAIGAVGVYGSTTGIGMQLLGYAVVVLLVCVAIDYLNRRVARKQIGDAIEGIDAQLKALEE